MRCDDQTDGLIDLLNRSMEVACLNEDECMVIEEYRPTEESDDYLHNNENDERERQWEDSELLLEDMEYLMP